MHRQRSRRIPQRALVGLLAICLLAGMVPCVGLAASGTKQDIYIRSTTNSGSGDTLSVEIRTLGSAVNGLLELTYDPQVLSVSDTSVKLSSKLTMSSVNVPQAGRLLISFLADKMNYDEVLATVSFTVLKKGAATGIDLTGTAYNASGRGNLSVGVYEPVVTPPHVDDEPDEPDVPDEPDEPDVPPVEHVYEDVQEDDWFIDDVYRLYASGIMFGTDPTHFEPATVTDRAMLATVVYRMAKTPEVTHGSGFTDVPDGLYYSVPVAWAVEAKVVFGVGDGLFEPIRFATRQEIATVLYRYAVYAGFEVDIDSSKVASFKDADTVASWSLDAMSWAVNSGIVMGRDDNTLDPTANATRCELAAMLSRFMAAYSDAEAKK